MKLNISTFQVRTRLSSYNIDPFSLQIIDQSKCAPPGHQGSLFQTVGTIKQKATNVVKNVGAKINELASDGTTKLQEVSKSVSEKGNVAIRELSKPIADNAAKLQEASKSVIEKGKAGLQDLSKHYDASSQELLNIYCNLSYLI